ncbi:MAG: rod shape-determining protein MreD [Peptococcaceae bacterium]|jgi:rod shape-determining protein MreD|nr:rod shape-determining protein MreD [Peptococcaceae bacterium]
MRYIRYLLLAVLFFFSLILPGTLFHFWSWGGVKPDLVMLLTIYFAMHHRSAVYALGTGIIFGLLQDLFLGKYIGMYALTLMVVAGLSFWLAGRWYRENLFLTLVLVFGVSLAGQAMIGFLGLAVGSLWSPTEILRLVLGIAVYNTILTPMTYPWIHHSFLYGWLRYRPKYER